MFKEWFKKMLNEAASAMINKVIDDKTSSRHINEEEMQLIRKGFEMGILKIDGNLFTVNSDIKRKYDAFTLNREYFTQFATLITLISKYKYPIKDCCFEYHLMDICVFKDRKPFIYVEVKVSWHQAEKLYKEIKEKYSKNVKKFEEVPDRGNDSLRKTKYIFKDRPKYFWIVTPNKKIAFVVEYTEIGFNLREVSDIPSLE